MNREAGGRLKGSVGGRGETTPRKWPGVCGGFFHLVSNLKGILIDFAFEGGPFHFPHVANTQVSPRKFSLFSQCMECSTPIIGLRNCVCCPIAPQQHFNMFLRYCELNANTMKCESSTNPDCQFRNKKKTPSSISKVA